MKKLFVCVLFALAMQADAQLAAPRLTTFLWENPTANTDGSPLAASAIQQTEIGCGQTPTYSGYGTGGWAKVGHLDGAGTEAQFTVPAGMRYCAAWTLAGLWSDPSAVVDLNTLAAPGPQPKKPRVPGNLRVR